MHRVGGSGAASYPSVPGYVQPFQTTVSMPIPGAGGQENATAGATNCSQRFEGYGMTMRQTMPFEEKIHPFSKICRAVPKNYLERKVWDPDVKKTVDIPLSHFYHTRCHYDQGYDWK